MALTPKPREALLAAFHAPGHALQRCGGGYFDRSRHSAPQSAPVVTVRTAITLIDLGYGEFDHPIIPSEFRLTAEGMAEAEHILADGKLAA